MLREILFRSREYLSAQSTQERFNYPHECYLALRSCLYRWAGDDEELIREANQFLLRMGTRRMNPLLWATARKVRFN